MEFKLLNTLQGHQNPIYSLSIDQKNNTLYSAGNDKGIVEWDLETQKFKRVLCAVPSSVYVLRNIPNTDLLIAGLRSGGIYIINTVEQKLVAKLDVEKGAVFSLEILIAKNELVAVDEYGKAYVWNLANYELLYSFNVSSTTVRSIAIHDKKGVLAFGDKNGQITICSSLDYHVLLRKKIHESSVSSLCIIDDILYSGGRDAKMYKLNIDDLSVVNEIVPHMFTIYGIQSTKNKQLVTISRDKTIKVWSEDFKLLKNVSRDKSIDSHYLSINSITYNSNTNIICTAGDDKLIKVWEIVN